MSLRGKHNWCVLDEDLRKLVDGAQGGERNLLMLVPYEVGPENDGQIGGTHVVLLRMPRNFVQELHHIPQDDVVVFGQLVLEHDLHHAWSVGRRNT